MAELDAALGENLADEQPPVALVGLTLAAEQRDAMLVAAAADACDGFLKRRCARHPVIESVSALVVVIGLPGPTPECVAEEQVTRTGVAEPRSERLAIELGRDTRVWVRADVYDELDLLASQELREPCERVIRMPDGPDDRTGLHCPRISRVTDSIPLASPPPALPLTARAPAKINLGLFLGATRADGRHELATVMQSISLADELTLGWAPADGEDRVVCPGVPGPPGENLAAAALAAFRDATGWRAPALELRIDKRVPVAAGLGGGSGDAAAALRLAAAASGLGDERLLLEIARALGADVPAQVSPGRWLARGAGERLSALADPGAPCGVLVLGSAAALSTAAVYAQADRMRIARDAAELQELAAALGAALATGEALPPVELLGNDLQDAARALCPEIDAALAQARAVGADVALVSGSGPTVLGLFACEDGPARAQEAARELTAERRAADAPAAIAAELVGVDAGAARPPRPA